MPEKRIQVQPDGSTRYRFIVDAGAAPSGVLWTLIVAEKDEEGHRAARARLDDTGVAYGLEPTPPTRTRTVAPSKPTRPPRRGSARRTA
jgi:hypothetical protein